MSSVWRKFEKDDICTKIYLDQGHLFLIEQYKFIASQFWRLDIWNQGVGKVDSFWALWEGICSLPLT